ncbi:MAG: citramalate synthase [Prochlorotrichaceae cyanobacterium]
MAETSSHSPVWIYDTTLRDGAQREGLSLSLEDKIRIAQQLDHLGIPFIEGGWPGANPKDVQFFWQVREQHPLSQSQLVAFCSTRRPQRKAADDQLLQAILAAGTHWVTLFGKSWDLHVTEGLKTSLEENIAMIADSIQYLRSQQRRVIYDAEHWFDGYKHNPDYALKTLEAALEAGAEWIVLCDTNGGTLPHELGAIVAAVNEAFHFATEIPSILDPLPTPGLGIHTHNDSETAVANAIAAVMGGARMVQGTMNGYGERCGNANLCSLIPNLQLKLGFNCLTPEQLTHLTPSSRLISEIANLAPNDHAAYVGLSAFAHKGGIHVSAVAKNPLTYEHITPDQVGNTRRIVVSDQAGLSNILAKAHSWGLELDKQDPLCRQLLDRLKTLENQGYQFESAEASFELLMREAMGNRPQFFELLDFQVHCVTRTQGENNSGMDAWATVKIKVNGEEVLAAGEGNGPVSALDAALRKALLKGYPQVEQFHLTDYKVRILDGTTGTAARTRVLIEVSNGQQRWITLGVSTNIIEASYQALVEAIEYGLLLDSEVAEPSETAAESPQRDKLASR